MADALSPFDKGEEGGFFDRGKAGKPSVRRKSQEYGLESHQYPVAKICSYSLPLTPDISPLASFTDGSPLPTCGDDDGSAFGFAHRFNGV
jgi:hypothetical protein